MKTLRAGRVSTTCWSHRLAFRFWSVCSRKIWKACLYASPCESKTRTRSSLVIAYLRRENFSGAVLYEDSTEPAIANTTIFRPVISTKILQHAVLRKEQNHRESRANETV